MSDDYRRPVPVDSTPDRVGQHTAPLPAGRAVPLPGDVLTVTDPDGRIGLARVRCTNMTARRVHVTVTWPHRPTRRVPAPALTVAVADAGGSVHPAQLAGELAREYATFRRTALGELAHVPEGVPARG